MREAEFEKAIRSVHVPVPHKRFAIYRNNVASGLVTALAVRFPVTQQLVGEEFFRAMAALYVENNKPASPVLIHYGETFSEFISTFEPARTVPYLADVARLENLWWRAYHAADAAVVDSRALSEVPQAALGGLRFRMHPSVGVMFSSFDVTRIWHAHHGGDALGTFVPSVPGHVLVSRPKANILVSRICAGFEKLFDELKNGVKLMDAVAAAADADPAFDLATALGQLFTLNLVSGVFHE